MILKLPKRSVVLPPAFKVLVDVDGLDGGELLVACVGGVDFKSFASFVMSLANSISRSSITIEMMMMTMTDSVEKKVL
jgi:hypothetical protein